VNNRDQLVADRLDAARTDPPTICVYTFNVVSTFACPINCATTFPDTRRSCDHDAYVRRNVTTPQVRTYGEIVGHLINANYSFCSAALSDQNPNTTDWQKVSEAAKLIAAMQAAIEFCDRVYSRARDSHLREMIAVPFGANGREQSGLTHGEQQMPRLTPLVTNIEHDFEHYGNLVTYMRLKGIVPPSTRRAAGQK